MNHPAKWKFGTVGEPVPGIEVRIAEDGEILTRGPHVMKGYFNNASETAAVIDAPMGGFTPAILALLTRTGLLKLPTGRKISLCFQTVRMWHRNR